MKSFPVSRKSLSDAVTEDAALGIDAIQGVDGNDSIPAVPSVITFNELDGTVFNGRAITSIAINPNNSNEIIVTLGNYGNTDYVFESTNGGTSFTSIQGKLPAMPVYSSIYVKEENTISYMLGTENGIYTSNDKSNWIADASVANIPVMDLKQQLQARRDTKYTYLIDEVGEVTTIEYPGVFNEGMIYIATYGRGLYKCDNYLVKDTENIMKKC